MRRAFAGVGVTALVGLASLTGCAGSDPNIPPAPIAVSADTNTIPKHSVAAPLSGPLKHTDFLSTYDDLAPLPGRPNVESFKSVELREFHTFIVDPVAILATRTVMDTEITPLQREQLAADLQSEMRETLRLAGKLATANAPGPGVGRIRAAVTELAKNITPNGARGGQLGGATVEAEVLDSQTGERLGAVIVSENVVETDELAPEKRDPFRDVRTVFASWAARMNKWLEAEPEALTK